MVYKVLAPAQRVQSVHSGVMEIIKPLMIRSSPLVAVGYLLRKLKYSLPVIFGAIMYFCQANIFFLIPVGSKCHQHNNSGANTKRQAVFDGPYSSTMAKEVKF